MQVFRKPRLWLIALVLLAILTPIVYLVQANIQRTAAAIPPLALISQNAPAYTNDDCNKAYPASQANDASYDTWWRSCTSVPSSTHPKWLAYDLSHAPASQRSKALVVWYNELTGDYNHVTNNSAAYNNPKNYTIETNSAAAGTLPTTGWTAKVTITQNTLHSRQHLVDLAGANWLRIRVTASEGSAQNFDVSLNMDVYNAGNGTSDDWIFFGDSITVSALEHQTINTVKSFQQLIHANNASYYPVQEDGGIGELSSADGVKHIKAWLNNFPGKYVGLSYGTNDALACVAPATFYHNYTLMVQAVFDAQKVPVIPHIPWSAASAIQKCAPALNQQIDKLYQNYPSILPGPDLYAFFSKNKSLISDDGIHLTTQGFAELRKQWANMALQSVYNNSTPSQPAPTPTFAPQPTSTLSATPTLAPKPSPSPTPGPNPQFSGLHVQGNKLVNDSNQVITLHGVNRSGTEYACAQGWGIFDGPSDDASVQAITSWKVNAVRVPLNEDCWLNINGVSSQYAGSSYKQAISNYVTLLNSHHLYAILDLHWSAPGSLQANKQAPMPDSDHSIAFWKDVAATFKGNTKVLFDVFNEPFPDNNGDTTNGWQCWRNGSTSNATYCSNTAYRDNNGNMTNYKVAGMQDLVSAIRSAGANNVILLGGLQYSNTLTHWLQYKPNDPANNLAASWHVYPVGNRCNSTTCYDNEVAPVVASVPLVATEVGESVDGSACSTSNTTTVLNWLDAHNAGYTAWTWDTWSSSCGNLSLITDYKGTPKSPNGTNYKNHLAAQ